MIAEDRKHYDVRDSKTARTLAAEIFAGLGRESEAPRCASWCLGAAMG